MEKDATNSTKFMLEAQLQRLIKVITDSTNVAAKEMRRYSKEGFFEVCTKKDYIYNVVVRSRPKGVVV